MTSILTTVTKLRRGAGAFTLVETLVATSISVAAMAMFFVAEGQAIRIVRAGKQTASASQLVQRRSESFHATKLWTNVITVSGFTALVANAPAAPATFAGATETYTVSAYPPNGTWFTVVRNPNGTTSTSGASLSASQRCVKITAQVNWTGAGTTARSRTQAILMAKGGV